MTAASVVHDINHVQSLYHQEDCPMVNLRSFLDLLCTVGLESGDGAPLASPHAENALFTGPHLPIRVAS